jgi:hypothetical protein
MAARDSLSPLQFPGPADTSDSDRNKAAMYDGLGADSDESYGFSDADMADYQYERYGKTETDTNPEPEVF